MAAPFHFIKRKVEDGFAAVLTFLAGSNLSGVALVKGLAGSALSTPRVEIIAHTATPEIIGDTVTGNWMVELTVNVITEYSDTTRAVHASNCGYVEDVIMRDDIPSQINTTGEVTDFTVFNGAMGWLPGASTDLVNGDDEYMSQYDVTVYCAPTTFA